MSIEAMNWALAQKTGSAASKLVLLILANRADHAGVCWPGFAGICEQTELSRRSVINHLQGLEAAGLLTVERRPQPKTNLYRLNLSGSAAAALVQGLHGAPAAPGSAGRALEVVQDVHPGSAPAAPEPKETQIEPTRTVSGAKRASRLPDDFELTETRRLVAEAERLPAERTFAKFCDYWRGVSGHRGRKVDWDATWRNWCRNDADRARNGQAGDADPYMDQLRRGAHANNR